jgi:hypothetical protein
MKDDAPGVSTLRAGIALNALQASQDVDSTPTLGAASTCTFPNRNFPYILGAPAELTV